MINKEQQAKLKAGLLQLGFSNKEIGIYLSILQTAEASILNVAKDTGLSRGTVYDVIEKLKQKGYVAEIKKGKKRRFVPENPTNQFYILLDQKHEQLEKSKALVENLLPIIKGINISEDFKPKIRVYTGEQGFRKVWDEIFSSEDKSFLSISQIETFEAFIGKDGFQELLQDKVKKNITSRVINQDTPAARKLIKLDKKQNRSSVLAPKEFKIPATEIIFDNKIAIFTTKHENLITVIESKDISDTHQAYFEMMWQCLQHKGGKNDIQ